MSTYIGQLSALEGVECCSAIDLFFTSLDREQMSETLQGYIEQIKGFDTDMRLQQQHSGQCTQIVYVQHQFSSTHYWEVVHRQQVLTDLHNAYHQHFGSGVLFDSGVHALATYNVTMHTDTSTGAQPQQANIQATAEHQALLRTQLENTARMARVLNVLGVPIGVDDIGTPNAMSLREDDRNSSRIIFSLVGAVLSPADANTLINTTIWLSTSRFAGASDAELVAMSSSITGTLFFGALSVPEAHSLCQHMAGYQAYVTATDALRWTALVTQSLVVRDSMMHRGIRLQTRLAPLIARSVYTMRVSVTVPVEASMLNALLIEVLKTVIFNKSSIPSVRLVSTHRVVHPAPAGPAAATLVVYEMRVASMQQCTLAKNTNTDDYYAELMNVVSGLFAVNVAIELQVLCLVTNTLHATTALAGLHAGSAAPSGCSNTSQGSDAFQDEFANASSGNSYSETCVLQTEVAVDARFDHLQDAPLHVQHVRDMRRTLAFGSTGPLLVATQATFRLHHLLDTFGVVGVFSNLYSPFPTRHANISNASSDAAAAPTKFTVYTHGVSADEKRDCTAESHTSGPAGCLRNLSISVSAPLETGCMEFLATNSRIDTNTLKRFVLAKTTTDMLQPAGIRIHSVLEASMESIECAHGVHNLVSALIRDQSDRIRLVVEPKEVTQHALVIQHTTPFVHIPDYLDTALRLAVATHNIKLDISHTTTTAVLHLYTTGVTHATAAAFFEIMMQEYIVTQILHTTNIRLEVAQIQRLEQYTPSFPGVLYNTQEALEQLYIQVHVHNMRECAEIQPIIAQQFIHKTIYGVSMHVTIIDTISGPVTCNNSIYLQYNSVSCRDAQSPNIRLSLLGKRISGGVVLSNNITCLAYSDNDHSQCTAHLSSSDVGLFYATLNVITGQLDPLTFHFKHRVFFCGLDMRLLRPLIDTESLDFFGTSQRQK